MRLIAACTLLCAHLGAAMAADVGVSISVGEPGFYGRIDIGNVVRPQVIYAEPVVIHRAPAAVAIPAPVYMHVPPGHAKNWARHCGKYGACGQPVYFVQERWYSEVYAPSHREGGKHRGKGRKGRNDD
ncbi:MAG TPA: hypothetical protein VIT02_15610 [Burkholderiaceae bacterium]